jgi:ribonuclease G
LSNELIISANSTEVNIALLEDKGLVELNKERSSTKFAVGDVYLAKVKKIVSGLNAVFVDLGYEKDAFLHYHDLGPQYSSLSKFLNLALSSNKPVHFNSFECIPDIDKNGNIADVIKSGQYILVQVAKEPISTKGPRLSSEISIAGRNIVLIPFSNTVSISKKIESMEEKQRLKQIINNLKPKNYGVIVRTVAVGHSVAELEEELKGLIQKWENLVQTIFNFRTQTPKLMISELDRITSILRDILNPTFTSIVVDNKAMFAEINNYLHTIVPDKEKILKLYTGGIPVFEYYGVEKQIRSLFGRHVPIKNGAYLIIEHTEALHVIDVNSGNRTKFEKDQESNAFDVNSMAALEIARQLRLRDMGGIIVVDFIDMKDPENKSKLFEIVKTAMGNDRARHNILPLSKFGILQITRQRVRPENNIINLEVCPCCNGKGEISPSVNLTEKIADDINHIAKVLKRRKFTLLVHPFIEGYLKKGLISISSKWKIKFKICLKVKAVDSFNFLEYKFLDKKGEDIAL